MIDIKAIWLLLALMCGMSCKNNQPTSVVPESIDQLTHDDIPDLKDEIDYDPGLWAELTAEDSGIILDIRYATKDNFTKEVIYPCARCFLRPELASRLIALNKGILERYQLRLKVFDCFRPLQAQQRLWDIVPNPSYVTPPEKGSMHNRGLAIDITLTNMAGVPLDMGSDYDHFGVEAHIDYLDLPGEILANRKLLQTMMKEIGLKGIRTEWWHYSLQSTTYELSSWEWPCEY